ncbi:MAG: C10 family peptidase, partial [Candidatus Cloacimonetes bacterium]|nr:C10 family peptidase [Candidatus Cloacimonadota bacterium]
MNKTSFFFTILLFIIFCCFFIFSLQAKPVGLETAIRVGVNIYAERADLRTSDIQVIEGITKKENSENLFYIFNIKDHGYVMVAADDAVFPVLGYNFEHHYTEENHPPQFDAMLESFSEQIINVKENNLTPDAKIEKAWQRLNVEPQNFEKIRDFRAVSPLLSTTWNQGQYYNEMCPSDASSTTGNNHVWAGCVATAMAQVMKYHAHPTVGDSSHGYNHSMYGNQFADFANTTYNWANMPNNVTSLNTDVQTILYHCGVSVDMDYGPTGSGASTSTAVVPALTTYFKYDTDAVFLWKSSFSTATWEQMIRNNLDNSRPLIYRGYDPGKKSRGGHCFNLDGYQSTNHFHFNWGWSGVHNGYYYLTNLNPGTHNYTSDQGGIFDLYPEPTINYDYGDAPDPTYPTLLASNGARHPNNGQTYLGSQIDTEADGLQSSDALGDDNNNLDDEDGVTFTTTLNPGQMATVQVTVSVDGYLNAWLDFDGDGSWAEVGDQIFKDKYLTAGTHNLDFLVRGPATGVTTFARFRFCSENGLSYDGEAVDGEVEDYEVDIEPDSSIKWAQYPDLSSLGMDINASNPLILADDWQCTETSNVTDIHFWGSWKDDMYELATDVTFTLSIHSDIPAGQQADWSMPGDVLWEKTWEPTMDDIVVIENCIEDWFDPSEPLFINDDHTKCIKYNLILDPSEYFLQEGTPDQPVIYWLSIQAQPLYDVPKFGWKTSTDHWNDDAVFVTGTAPYSGDAWQELIYPVDHPYSGESIDLAFEITGEDTGEELDFGDAPDPTYPTLSANTGASHVIDYVTYMGDTIDAETDGQPNSTATGDDVANLDDEDGVTFTSILVPGYTSYVTVNTSVDGFLNAWLDFNGDGDWADSDEQIFNDATLTAGDNYLSFSVPATAIIDTTFARFRFNTAGGLSYTGEAADGEVEDYQIVIHDSIPDSKLHYPQWPDPHGWDVKFDPPNVIADDWQCIESGPVTDVHFWISFQGDNLPDPFPGIDSVHLSIHNDYEPYAGYYTPWYQSIW